NLRLYFSEDIAAPQNTDSSDVTSDFTPALIDNGVAYYRINGFIGYESDYTNSLSNLETSIKEAENNSNISLHFFHINSFGGEAYYNERIASLIRSLSKTTYCLIERNCCSAGYYLASQCNRIVASTSYDYIGSIGTMTVLYDDRKYFDKAGVQFITIKATKSDLKNKLTEDAIDGKTGEYIARLIDPFQKQFEKDVRFRKKLSKLPEDHEVFRGQVYLATEALAVGLIDAIADSKEAVINEVVSLAKKSTLHKKILNFI
ncbi:MAG: S49 family peptidase, partial [Rikenellaceae bacterium]